ncbi:MAG TPA: hypothetical protein VLF69_04500 [Candidatus Saccharimonadales bacterium]|nr:hypothetical protein [Candidatus Saccharimonadales bacterium]
MKLPEYDAAVVFGIEPVMGPGGIWQLPDETIGCLDAASRLLAAGIVGIAIVSGGRAVRQRWLSSRSWHPNLECDMGRQHMIERRGCSEEDVWVEPLSEDSPSNLDYTTRIAIANRLGRVVGIVPPARERHVDFLASLTIRPYCHFEIITTDYPNTREDFAARERTLAIHQFGFRDIVPGDLDALEARFFDGEPYPYFRYLDQARDHAQRSPITAN